jgi:hypothetical protein
LKNDIDLLHECDVNAHWRKSQYGQM